MPKTLESIRYTRNPLKLEILNQLLLPHQTIYDEAKTVQDGYVAIKTMRVRGAPAIGIVAALSLAVDLQRRLEQQDNILLASTIKFIRESLDFLKTARPTAVNLFRACDELWEIADLAAKTDQTPKEVTEKITEKAEEMLRSDVKDNQNIGRFGAEFIAKHSKEGNVKVLTHCNTGSLATGGYGTALGIIRSLHAKNKLAHAYCTETRPYNQGSRLTSYELLHDGIPSTLICDSMVSALLSEESIVAIIVGADRVARNGDTANKIGTYQLAVTAKYHGIMFIVAAPTTSIDLGIKSGKDIVIEERSADEMIYVSGVRDADGEIERVKVAPENVRVWNPSFDVTPASLITAVVTEKGVASRDEGRAEFDLIEFLK